MLELDSGEDFEVTLFLDSFGHDLKSGMVDRVNTFLDNLRRYLAKLCSLASF